MNSLMYKIKFIFLIILLVGITGCDKRNDNLSIVTNKVNIFQKEYNNHNFKKMYEMASDEFKQVMPEEKFYFIMQDKMNKLGLYKKSKILYSLDKNDDYVKITYISEYEKYTLAEEFGYRDKKNGEGFQMLSFLVDMGGYISPVTKNKESIRIDIGNTSN